MNDSKQKLQQMRKGTLEYCLLLILNKKAKYTKEILKDFKSAKMNVVEGTLYPLLSRLNKQDLLSYEWEEAKTGHPRKYYKITKEGKKVLKDLNKAWKDMEYTINSLQQ